jgi:hypothetical protein
MRVPPIHSFEDRMVTMSMSQEDRIAGVLRETLQKSGLRPGEAIAVLLAAIQGIVREEVAPHEYTRAVAAIAHVLRLFATHRQNEKEAA